MCLHHPVAPFIPSLVGARCSGPVFDEPRTVYSEKFGYPSFSVGVPSIDRGDRFESVRSRRARLLAAAYTTAGNISSASEAAAAIQGSGGGSDDEVELMKLFQRLSARTDILTSFGKSKPQASRQKQHKKQKQRPAELKVQHTDHLEQRIGGCSETSVRSNAYTSSEASDCLALEAPSRRKHIARRSRKGPEMQEERAPIESLVESVQSQTSFHEMKAATTQTVERSAVKEPLQGNKLRKASKGSKQRGHPQTADAEVQTTSTSILPRQRAKSLPLGSKGKQPMQSKEVQPVTHKKAFQARAEPKRMTCRCRALSTDAPTLRPRPSSASRVPRPRRSVVERPEVQQERDCFETSLSMPELHSPQQIWNRRRRIRSNLPSRSTDKIDDQRISWPLLGPFGGFVPPPRQRVDVHDESRSFEALDPLQEEEGLPADSITPRRFLDGPGEIIYTPSSPEPTKADVDPDLDVGGRRSWQVFDDISLDAATLQLERLVEETHQALLRDGLISGTSQAPPATFTAPSLDAVDKALEELQRGLMEIDLALARPIAR